MSRRWSVSETGHGITVSGIDFRVVPGSKFPGDLRIEWRTASGWVPVKMAAAFLLTDFFVENEDARVGFMPDWRESGRSYFFRKLNMSVDDGWQAASRELTEQRVRLGTIPAPASTASRGRLCGTVGPEGEPCFLQPDHEGPHESRLEYWPSRASA